MLLVISVLTTVFSTLLRPWIGIIAYYFLAILGPQYIWWWTFDGLRVSLWVAIATFGGITFALVKHGLDFTFFRTRLNFWLFVLWLNINISYFLGPYVSQFAASGLSPEQVYSVTNNIFLFYFCSTLVINGPKSLRYLAFVFVIASLYLIFWANNQYFTQNWSQFNMGRLMGPHRLDGSSIYGDENAFAMLFVTAIPFIYYLGLAIPKVIYRYLVWLAIPFGWHAVFLTGSRGGLIGLLITVFIVVIQSKRKLLALPLILAFIIAYQWQGGSIMKQRGQMIADYQGESSAEMRVTAWSAGLKMIASHPITGVGIGSFITALPHFSDTTPRVAHNTFIQFTAESGLGAGFAYLMILGSFLNNCRQIRNCCKNNKHHAEIPIIHLLNAASTVSFIGLITCSIFLSLNIYEIFFFLLIFNNTLMVYCMQLNTSLSDGIDIEQT
ncbi:O-antigen ligase family protein [Desulforhabdus sp. TSK]|uniref:O-antigen ligase family protein n=1 Tax=Desulforhabdus sp. TSK TaxID=2925014 RepID=UPI001FC85314|nr:O-antigen ligase family protein [Desulforhabdus sp. TSK]